ncbi:MAG: hypothetical protein L0Y48_04025 [Fusobacteria bacterium]|nr:hypothetical protein [Fusobacteriota bacterium]
MSYQILVAEGFLESKEKKGYFVTGLQSKIQNSLSTTNEKADNTKGYLYDFSTYYLDEKYFDKKTWKRHLNYVLKDEKKP